MKSHCPVTFRSGNPKGNAIVELALVASVSFGLVLAVFDRGTYVHLSTSVLSAGRSAALRNSGSTETAGDQTSVPTCGTAAFSADGAYSRLVIVKRNLPFVFGIPMTGAPLSAALSQISKGA
jgi:Flp pilus assembly protein TadG